MAATSWNPAGYTGTGPFRYMASTYSTNGKQLTIQDANDNQTDYQYDRHDRVW